LSAEGQDQAELLVPLLTAFGVTAVHTSSSTRCVDSVRPFAEVAGLDIATYDSLTEEGARADGVRDVVGELLAAKECAVLCTHRPVLPAVLEDLGVARVQLEKAEMLVVHHRRGTVVATETQPG
jgi:8-oxo-dGTP diphosphatase